MDFLENIHMEELMKIFKRYQKVLSPSDSRIWYCTKIAKKEKDLIKSLIA